MPFKNLICHLKSKLVRKTLFLKQEVFTDLNLIFISWQLTSSCETNGVFQNSALTLISSAKCLCRILLNSGQTVYSKNIYQNVTGDFEENDNLTLCNVLSLLYSVHSILWCCNLFFGCTPFPKPVLCCSTSAIGFFYHFYHLKSNMFCGSVALLIIEVTVGGEIDSNCCTMVQGLLKS